MIAFIKDHLGVHGVELICEVLPIAHPPTTRPRHSGWTRSGIWHGHGVMRH